MSKYTPLKKSIWRDKDFKKSKKDAKLLFLYLISNESINNSGIYEIPISTISEETTIGVSTVRQLLVNGSIKNIEYDMENEIAYVVNRRKHSPGGNPHQVERGIVSEFKQTSKSFLWNSFIKLNPQFKDIFPTLAQPLANGSIPLPLPIPLQDSKDLKDIKPLKIEKEKTVEVEILVHLNEKAGKKFQPTETNLGFISARLAQGHTKADCFHVIEVKTEQWLDDIKWDKFLRPETLFNNSKFTGYVNEKKGLTMSRAGPSGKPTTVRSNIDLIQKIDLGEPNDHGRIQAGHSDHVGNRATREVGARNSENMERVAD